MLLSWAVTAHIIDFKTFGNKILDGLAHIIEILFGDLTTLSTLVLITKKKCSRAREQLIHFFFTIGFRALMGLDLTS